LLHLVGLTRHFILRMHGHTNIKYRSLCWQKEKQAVRLHMPAQ